MLVKTNLALVVLIVDHEFVVLLPLLIHAFFVVFTDCAVHVFHFSETLLKFINFCVIVLYLCVFVCQLGFELFVYFLCRFVKGKVRI